MRKVKIGIYTWITIVSAVCLMLFFSDSSPARANGLCIVLDAGHDDTHTGAAGNNLREENLNLQIALACKNELETYEGVKVYMIRETGACPYGGQSIGSSVKCNKKRVEFAQSVGADAYISLHNNSSVNTSAKGVSVYYPTTNYRSYCGKTGEGLARSIIGQLVTTGLQNRGISVRYSEDGTRYPDGSLADYYGVIKNSKLAGIPAIIVEHAFISNANDASEYLSTYGKLWALGTLDAKGIAQYYGLHKKTVLDYSKAVFTSESQNNSTQYSLQAAGITGAESVQFAVWSDAGGQDDLKVYNARIDAGGNWKAVVPIAEHGSEGQYFVDIYVNQEICIGHMAFSVEGPSAGRVEIVNADGRQGSFLVEAAGVTSGTDIDSVSAAVWNTASPDQVKWFPAVDCGNGFYQLSVDISHFNYEYGTYQVHTYIRDKNAIVKCVATSEITLEASQPLVEVTGGGITAVYQADVQNVPYGDGMREVTFRLWRETVTPEAVTSEGVTADAVSSQKAVPEKRLTAEFDGARVSSGRWHASIYPAEIGKEGNYRIQVVGRLLTGREVILGETSFYAEALQQNLIGNVQDSNQTLWKGKGIEVLSEGNRDQMVLKMMPWCDYASIRSLLEQRRETCRDYVAYELAMEEMIPAQLWIDIPAYMASKEVVVFQVVTGEPWKLVELEAAVSDDGSRIMAQAETGGLYVIAAKEEGIKGDADLNQKIELQDAQLVLRAALGIDRLDAMAEKYCDINENGKIDLVDAQLILKAALGIIRLV